MSDYFSQVTKTVAKGQCGSHKFWLHFTVFRGLILCLDLLFIITWDWNILCSLTLFELFEKPQFVFVIPTLGDELHLDYIFFSFSNSKSTYVGLMSFLCYWSTLRSHCIVCSFCLFFIHSQLHPEKSHGGVENPDWAHVIRYRWSTVWTKTGWSIQRKHTNTRETYYGCFYSN